MLNPISVVGTSRKLFFEFNIIISAAGVFIDSSRKTELKSGKNTKVAEKILESLSRFSEGLRQLLSEVSQTVKFGFEHNAGRERNK